MVLKRQPKHPERRKWTEQKCVLDKQFYLQQLSMSRNCSTDKSDDGSHLFVIRQPACFLRIINYVDVPERLEIRLQTVEMSTLLRHLARIQTGHQFSIE